MNTDIKAAAKNANVKLWQVADAVGVTDATFSRWLRHTISEDRRAAIFEAIEKLSVKEERG